MPELRADQTEAEGIAKRLNHALPTPPISLTTSTAEPRTQNQTLDYFKIKINTSDRTYLDNELDASPDPGVYPQHTSQQEEKLTHTTETENTPAQPPSEHRSIPIPTPTPVVAATTSIHTNNKFEGQRHAMYELMAGHVAKRREAEPAPSEGVVRVAPRTELGGRHVKPAEKGRGARKEEAVLVVEDEPINRKILVRMLRQLLGPSATIHEAADGTEAVDLCAKLVSSSDVSSEPTTVTSNSALLMDDMAGAISIPLSARDTSSSKSTSSSPKTSPSPSSPPATRPPNQPPTIPNLNTTTSNTTTTIETTPTPNPLSVIFMDIIMPTMDGYTASQHIRNMGIKTPIVVTTANMPDEEKGREVGVVEVVRKPFTKARVKGVLEMIGIL